MSWRLRAPLGTPAASQGRLSRCRWLYAMALLGCSRGQGPVDEQLGSAWTHEPTIANDGASTESPSAQAATPSVSEIAEPPPRSMRIGPRCGAEDPECLPIAARGAPIFGTDPMLEPGYQPGLPRNTSSVAPIWSSGAEGEQCSHDGDCVRGGCGNHCVHWKDPGFMGTCQVEAAVREAHCGCVAQRCYWFTQPRRKVVIDLWNVIDVTPNRVPAEGQHGWDGYSLEQDHGWRLSRGELLHCYKQHVSSLPQQLQLVLHVSREGKVQSARVSGGSAPIRNCTQKVLSTIPLGDRNGTWQKRTTGARVKATLDVRVEQLD